MFRSALKTNEDFVVTHPDKIYFPQDKYTKQDLIDYYTKSPIMIG